MRRPSSGWYSTSVSTMERSILNGLLYEKINWHARNPVICICIGAFFPLSIHHLFFARKHTFLIVTRQRRFPFLFFVHSFVVCHDRHRVRQACRHRLHSTIWIFFSHLNNSNWRLCTMVKFKAALKGKIDTCLNVFPGSFFPHST